MNENGVAKTLRVIGIVEVVCGSKIIFLKAQIFRQR